MDTVPPWVVFVGTIVLVMITIEVGYRVGARVHKYSKEEKESPSSVVSQSVLSLTAFMLAFTFGIVANRFEVRKQLVREEANAIGTAWLRADFLPDRDRHESRKIMKDYVGSRLAVFKLRFTETQIPAHFLSEAKQHHDRIWEIAVANANKDASSQFVALYVDSVNEVIDIHALRVAQGPGTRIPTAIWLVLLVLILLGMTASGYQAGIAGSKKPKSRPILAVAFALVIALVADLDRPGGGVIGVSHQPMIDLHTSMADETSISRRK